MSFSWSNLRSLIIFFGPILLPKAIGWFRSVRQAQRRANLPVTPPSPAILRALAFLAAVTILHLTLSLPWLAPENIFTATQSRLQIPVDVLFTRLSSLRPANTLTPLDEALRARLVREEGKLLYLKYGPEVMAACPFCRTDDPSTFLYYALPALLAPHVLNLVALALTTSYPVSGAHGARWRGKVTVAAVVLAVADLYAVQSYSAAANARAVRLAELTPFFWNARAARFVALAALDAGLAFLVFLSATNRAFARPPSAAGRLESANRALATARSKMAALGIVRNATVRDEGLRSRSAGYWNHEVRLMGEVMEEREVVDGVNEAVGSGRLDMVRIERDAEEYASGVLMPHVREKKESHGDGGEEAPVKLVG